MSAKSAVAIRARVWVSIAGGPAVTFALLQLAASQFKDFSIRALDSGPAGWEVFSVVLERVGQELERDERTRKFALLVEIRGVLLDAGRDAEPARGETPEEVVVSIPFVDLLLG